MFAVAIALLTAVSGRLSKEYGFLQKVGAPLKSGCVKTGQCYNGNNAAGDCCVGHVIDDALHCTEALTCSACETAAKWIVGALVKQGCVAIIPEGAVACEAIGLGPEDPFADICAVIVSGSCLAISQFVSKGTTAPEKICQGIGYCSDGGGTGRIFGTKCGCVESGSCTANDDGCCSGKASYGFNHCVAIGLKICE